MEEFYRLLKVCETATDGEIKILGYDIIKDSSAQSKIQGVNLCNMHTVILHKNRLLFFIPATLVFVTVLFHLSFFML